MGSREGPEHLDGLTGCGMRGTTAEPLRHHLTGSSDGRMYLMLVRSAHSTRMAKGILPSDPRRSSRCHSAAHYPSKPTMAFDSQSGGAEW